MHRRAAASVGLVAVFACVAILGHVSMPQIARNLAAVWREGWEEGGGCRGGGGKKGRGGGGGRGEAEEDATLFSV